MQNIKLSGWVLLFGNTFLQVDAVYLWSIEYFEFHSVGLCHLEPKAWIDFLLWKIHSNYYNFIPNNSQLYSPQVWLLKEFTLLFWLFWILLLFLSSA